MGAPREPPTLAPAGIPPAQAQPDSGTAVQGPRAAWASGSEGLRVCLPTFSRDLHLRCPHGPPHRGPSFRSPWSKAPPLHVPATPLAAQTPAVLQAALPAPWALELLVGGGPGGSAHHAPTLNPRHSAKPPGAAGLDRAPLPAPPEVDSATCVPTRPSPSLSLRLASDMNDGFEEE